MAKQNFKKRYRDLEVQVFATLRDAIENSEFKSEHLSEKAIKVNVFDYTELSILNDRLVLLDHKGFHYSIYSDCTLEDLIDIINKLEDE